jgi:hypothetical protein
VRDELSMRTCKKARGFEGSWVTMGVWMFARTLSRLGRVVPLSELN